MSDVKIVTAKSAGFCFGVERAVKTVYDELDKGGRIYTYGPIIHNETVVDDLKRRGVSVIENEDELGDIKDGIVIIRSHGAEKRIYDKIENAGLSVVDATCPFVKKIHDIVNKESSEGKVIIIIGNPDHAEVKGIMGWCNGETFVVSNEDEANNLKIDKDKEGCIVSQTTFNHNKFQELVEIFSKKGYYINVVDTICNATSVRQTEAAELSGKADMMIVIGGNHSSNSRKLYEICKERCEDTLFIATAQEFRDKAGDFFERKSPKLIGITAGASTPKKIIEEVQNDVRAYV